MAPPATAAISTASPRRGHVAVCTFPFSSHPGTLFLLSRKIAASSPDVDVSFFTTRESAAALSATFRSAEPNLRTFDVDDGLPEGHKGSHPLEAMKCFFEAAGEGIRMSMAAAEREVGVGISCVVADAFLSDVCRGIAEERAVKWVALWTSAAAALVAHMHTDQLRTRIGAEGVEAHKHDTLNEYIPGTPPISIGNLPREVLVADLKSPVSRMLHLMSLSLQDAAAIAINSFDHLESATTSTLNANFGNKFLHAGPFTLTLPSTTGPESDQHGCLPWLDTRAAIPASVVYISFGTAYAPPAEELAALAEALEPVGVPFLWSLSTDSSACLPEGFVERTKGKGLVVPWAPQISVLSHVAVGAHLTHCGWNSVTESIVCGVPMICRPMTIGDQLLNKELVESVWEIGVELEGGKLTKSAVVRAVERVLLGEEGRRMREKIRAMKRFAEEAAAEPRGGSVQNLNKFIGVITG